MESHGAGAEQTAHDLRIQAPNAHRRSYLNLPDLGKPLGGRRPAAPRLPSQARSSVSVHWPKGKSLGAKSLLAYAIKRVGAMSPHPP